jgi:hypothetical protein
MGVRIVAVLTAALMLGAALMLTVGLFGVTSPQPAAAVDVGGDDATDSYLASGSLLLPASVPIAERRTATDCPGCAWRADFVCRVTTATACRGQARMCRPDEGWYRFFVSVNGGPWRVVGVGCVGPGGPTTPEEVERRVAEVVRASVPPLRPGAQPRRALVGVPVVLWSGQPRTWRSRVLEVAGHRVRVVARPTWVWQFTDGVWETAAVPGGRWPDTSLTYAFASAGERVVRVTTRWQATYTVNGVGPLPVAEVVRQEAAVPVVVHEARPVLVR